MQPSPDLLATMHAEVLGQWRAAAQRATAMGFFDKGATLGALKVRANALATHEGLINNQAALAQDTLAFAHSVESLDPFKAARPWIAVAGGVLSFFGLLSADKLLPALLALADGAQTAGEMTGAAVTSFLAIASGGILVAIFRGAAMALQGLARAFENRGATVSAAQQAIDPAREAETKIFAAFGVPVPSPNLSPGMFVGIAVGGAVGGIVAFAFVMGFFQL